MTRVFDRQLMDIDGLAERVGVGERFVRRLVEQRRIPFVKVGGLVRFDPRNVNEWIEAGRVDALQNLR